MMEAYSSLNRAQLSFEYLHTNSTTHEFLFGAIAELIDNSRDAGATELDIYAIKDDSLRGCYMLCFADNGCGMSTDECQSVIIFGRSLKKQTESSSIGMYGNGLKSGSMRIGNDMILFTKKDQVMTCLFLSRTFHEQEKIYEIIVPMPAFKGPEKTPIVDEVDKKKHEIELGIILQYSPFKSQKDLFSQFDKIKSASGTLVIIYNMKLLDNGEPELDINTDSRDILLTHPESLESAGVDVDVELVDERRSLRAYVSILYADPRMKVYLQGRKVQTKRLISNLGNRRMYNFASKTFKTRSEGDANKAKEEVKIAELRAKEAESKARDLEARFGTNLDAEQLRTVRKARNVAMELREQVKQRQNALVRKQRAMKDPKTLTFFYGINLENRACDGMFVYNCSRLIKMYQRIGPQQDSGMTCRGVVGVVNVPYLVLEPTHNKQDFADAKEYRALLRAMADHLMQYWDDMRMDEKNLDEFWAKFGYLSAKWRDPPSQDDVYVRRRALNIKPCVQCDQCLKWRILPFQQKRIGQEVPDSWQCKDNPDPRHKRCSEPEEQLDIPLGVLKRKIKTKEQRQSELEEQIRKKQQELEEVKRITYGVDDEMTNGAGVGTTNRRSAAIASKQRGHVDSSSEEEQRTEEKPVVKARSSSAAPTVNHSHSQATAKKPGNSVSSSSHSSHSHNKSKPPEPKAAPTKRRVLPKSSSEEEEEEESVEKQASSPCKRLRNTSEPFPIKISSVHSKSELVENHSKSQSSVDVDNVVAPLISSVYQGSGDGSAVKREPCGTIDTLSAGNLINRAVDVRMQKQILRGKIVEVQDGKVRIRFDTMPEASHDRWFLTNSSDVTLLPLSIGTVSENDYFSEAQILRILDNFRNTLRYFLPPEWPMSKENIFRLTSKELAEFPMETFFDRYEQGLRGLFNNIQTDLTQSKEKLAHCRQLIGRFLSHSTTSGGNSGDKSLVPLNNGTDTENMSLEGRFERWLQSQHSLSTTTTAATTTTTSNSTDSVSVASIDL